MVKKNFIKKGLVVVVIIVLVSVFISYFYTRSLWVPIYQKVAGKRTVTDVVQMYGVDVDAKLIPYFEKAGINYPPQNMTLLAIKNEERLELWSDDGGDPKYIRDYQIKAASGVLGPKLREGDRQVPEGIYELEYLNPNSSYHLSMKINYPNEFDRKHALLEGRDQPGTNIFIHGKSVSIGCLAMGDNAIEELFVLVAKIGRSKVKVAIAPTDPRVADISNISGKPWVDHLYNDLSVFFDKYVKKAQKGN